jgi:hypothetical protein
VSIYVLTLNLLTTIIVAPPSNGSKWQMGFNSAFKGLNLKVKRFHPRTSDDFPKGEWRYSSTLSLTSALDGVGDQRHVPAALPPGKTRYPLYRRLGGPQGRSGLVRKISSPPGFDPRAVQPVTSRDTN